jgi:hypothetical protein
MKYLTAILLVLISAAAVAQDNIADCDRLMMDSINQVAQLEKADTDSFNKIFLAVHDASLRLHACSFLVLELPGESTLKPIISFDLPEGSLRARLAMGRYLIPSAPAAATQQSANPYG